MTGPAAGRPGDLPPYSPRRSERSVRARPYGRRPPRRPGRPAQTRQAGHPAPEDRRTLRRRPQVPQPLASGDSAGRDGDSGDVVVFGTATLSITAWTGSRPRPSRRAELNLVHPLTGPLLVRRRRARATCSPSPCSISSRTSSATRSSCRASDSCATCSRTVHRSLGSDAPRRTSPDIPGVGSGSTALWERSAFPGPGAGGNLFSARSRIGRGRWVRSGAAAARCAAEQGVRPDGKQQGPVPRTIPPRENGGNMDIKQMQVGPRCCCPASSRAACSPSATSTSRRATVRSRAPRSRWTRR